MGSSTNGDDSGAGWREHRNFNLDDVELLKLTSKTLEVKLGAGNETIVRDLRFASTQEAATFRDAVTKLKTLESERAARQVAKYRAASLSIDGGPAKKKPTKAAGDELSSPLNADETIAENDDEEDDDERVNLLVEIVSARDLPVADITSTDAYIVVRMKGKEIHRTGVVGKNLSPIWTVENGSLFLLQMSPEEFFSSQSGMTFVLKGTSVDQVAQCVGFYEES